MKAHIFIAALFFAAPLAAQQPTGHVVSAGRLHPGVLFAAEQQTEIQVGNLIYESLGLHKQVQVGKDYPVNVETNKQGVAKKLVVIAGDKKYTYRIMRTREVKSN